jgi:hypothetical protein
MGFLQNVLLREVVYSSLLNYRELQERVERTSATSSLRYRCLLMNGLGPKAALEEGFIYPLEVEISLSADGS